MYKELRFSTRRCWNRMKAHKTTLLFLKNEFKKEGWDEGFIASIDLQDAILIGEEEDVIDKENRELERLGEKGEEEDLVDINTGALLVSKYDIPHSHHSGNTDRPEGKEEYIEGEWFYFSFYHDGSVIGLYKYEEK